MSNQQIATRQTPAQSFSIGSGITVSVASDTKWSLSTAAAMLLIGPAHPDKKIDEMTLSAYDVILRNYPPALAAAAAEETLARVKWFPKPQEIAESARMILSLITAKGMYATNEAARERREKIRVWEMDCLEDTRDFIQRARTERELRAEIAAFTRRREIGG